MCMCKPHLPSLAAELANFFSKKKQNATIVSAGDGEALSWTALSLSCFQKFMYSRSTIGEHACIESAVQILEKIFGDVSLRLCM